MLQEYYGNEGTQSNPPKAVLYARYSPRPKDADSIGAQMIDMHTWCSQENITVKAECYDEDTSGTLPFWKRAGLAEALEKLSPHDYFVVRNLNRAARSVEVGLAVEEEIVRRQAVLVSLEDGGVQKTKVEDRSGWCMRVIKYLMADMQRQEMNERTSRRMQQWQITGRAMGGKAPYGYRKEGHKLIQVPEEQKVVNAMMRLRESGYTCRAILTWLQRHKIKPRVKWHLKTVQRIVRRETKRAQQKLG